MARGFLTDDEINILSKNNFVTEVTKTHLKYSFSFKCLFISEFLAGKKPTQIFRDAGFDV